MNFLLQEYQNGNKNASLYILDKYSYFINQFMDLLYNEDIDTSDNNLMDFLELYNGDNTNNAIKEVHLASKTVEPQEMYHEIVSIILTLAHQCDPDEDFDIYLFVCFKYRLYEKLMEYNKTSSNLFDACMFLDDEDTYWVLNNKNETIFSDITILQRIILKMHYIDELSIFHIADILHVDHSMIDEEYFKAINILKDRCY